MHRRRHPPRAPCSVRSAFSNASAAHNARNAPAGRKRRRPHRDAASRAEAPTQRAATPNAARTRRNAKPRRAAPAQARIQQRQERLLQRREDRALRNVPPAQRAARREQIQQQRQERAAQRQGIQPNAQRGIAQPNAVGAPNAQRGIAAPTPNRGLRRNGQARVTPQAARQGRFAARFANAQARAGNGQNARAAFPQARIARYAPRRAWQRGIRAAFVPWYGPVFWPYAYSDIFSYTFFPGGYEDTYWDYAYDDFFDGVFYGEVGPPVEYVTETTGSAPARAAHAAQPTYQAVRDVCATPGGGITAWPTAEIDSKVGLNAEQKQLLGDVKEAGSQGRRRVQGDLPVGECLPADAAGPSRLDDRPARRHAASGAGRQAGAGDVLQLAQ